MSDVAYTLKADVRRAAFDAVAGKGEGAKLNIITVTKSVTARADGNTMKMVRLPSNARIHGVSTVYFDDLATTGAPTLDIGIAPVDDSANKITADPDALNDGIALASAGTAKVIKDHANYGKRLFELLGLAEDPNGFLDIYVSFVDAVTDTTGDVTMEVGYSID